jgi:hypothetical protein
MSRVPILIVFLYNGIMRNKILSAVFSLALLVPVGAMAQTTSTSSPESRIEAHRSALQVKLQKIKDEVRRKVVEKIDSNVIDLNGRTTDHYLNVLDQISAVLNRVVTNTDKAQADGKDVGTVRAKIAAAQEAINSARLKVQAQATKAYTINVTTDSGLKGAVQTVRKALHDDLAASRDAVKSAREAVKAAITALGKLSGEASSTQEKTGSSNNQ